MEGLSFVHGFGNETSLGFNPNVKRDYFDYTQMTEGEFKLHLLAGKLRTLQQAHADDENVKKWQLGENYLLNAIHKGLHGTKNASIPTGYIDSSLNNVIENIKTAQNRFQSATKNGMFLTGRSNVGFGVNPLDQLTPTTEGGVNGYPFKDGCKTMYCNSNTYPCTDATQTGVDVECNRLERIKETLNTYLETSSHHILYNFMTDEQATNLKATQNWKVGQHILSVAEMAKISGVSVSNMNEWISLGIMRNNATRGAGALSANETIVQLMQNPDFTLENVEGIKNQYGIGGIPAAAYIIVACVMALVAITGMIQVLKGQEPTALDRIKGIGTMMFSPNGSDFPKLPTGGGGTGSGTNTCPVGYKWDILQNKCIAITTGGGGTTPTSGGGGSTGLMIGAAALIGLVAFKK